MLGDPVLQLQVQKSHWGKLTSLLHHLLVVGEEGEWWGKTSGRGHRSILLTCSGVDQL